MFRCNLSKLFSYILVVRWSDGKREERELLHTYTSECVMCGFHPSPRTMERASSMYMLRSCFQGRLTSKTHTAQQTKQTDCLTDKIGVDDAGGRLCLAALLFGVLDPAGTASFAEAGAPLSAASATAERATDAGRLVPGKTVRALLVWPLSMAA